jgi:DNA-directed RNA polymerase subunit L
MAEDSRMATIQKIKSSKNDFEFECEFNLFPVTFVNALRRIILGSIPTVVVQDIQILNNTTQMPHEMLKHRLEMLPINVNPGDAPTIRDTVIELNILENKDQKGIEVITTNNFTVASGIDGLIMKDRDLDTPLLFTKVRPGEGLHVRGRLGVEPGCQVCVCTSSWAIDEEMAEAERKIWVEQGNDVREFNTLRVQRLFARDERGRPTRLNFSMESIGVLKCREIIALGLEVFRKQLSSFIADALDNIQREKDQGSCTVSLEQGGHTIAALFQEVMYSDMNVSFVAYDIPHPLRKTTVLKFHSSKTPESILKLASETIEEYCSEVEKVL